MFNDVISSELQNTKLQELVYEGDNSIVYKAIDLETSQPRAVKIHKAQYPSENQKNKFLKEFEIGSQLDTAPSVISYYRCFSINHGKSNAIIMEDFEGKSLYSILQQVCMHRVRLITF